MRTKPVMSALADERHDSLRKEVVGLLARLLRADTSNPPGDVRAAAAVLDDYFRSNGIEASLVGESPELMNCVVRLVGNGDGPTLLMLGHLDVVPADAVGWSVAPFSGVVRDAYVWGRGALDMKNQVAAQAVAFAHFARRAAAGDRLRGDLLFVATADEETGEHCGAKWLLDQSPELVRADFLVNEGGTDMFELGDRRLYTIHAGEKGYAYVHITVGGRAGHASVPLHQDNAVLGLARIISALDQYEPEVSMTQLPTRFIDRVVTDPRLRKRLKNLATARSAVRDLAIVDRRAAQIVEPLLGLTLSPTIVRAGNEAANVIPSSSELTVDCRVLPGQSMDDIRREVESALAGVDEEWEMELLSFVPGNESPMDSPLRTAIVGTMSELLPNADVICEHCGAWFTDSFHFRSAFPDIVAYGFCPFVVENGAAIGPRMHSVDERIAVDDLVFQACFFERLARRLLA